MAKYDESKLPEEMDFSYIQIWVRAMKMPLGEMNREVGAAIGSEIGEFLEMEAEEDGTVVGQFLRIMVRMDIRKPLMQGVTLFVGAEGKPLWCPLVYEFVPDFCYTCGIIGHTDRMCDIKLKKDEVQQYSKSLRFIPEKMRWEEGGSDRYSGGRAVMPWRASGSGSIGSWGGGSGRRSRSDAPSWRRSEGGRMANPQNVARDEDEVTSPLKLTSLPKGGDAAKQALF